MHGPGALADRANCREVVLPATSFNPSLAAYRTWPRWPGSAKWLWLIFRVLGNRINLKRKRWEKWPVPQTTMMGLQILTINSRLALAGLRSVACFSVFVATLWTVYCPPATGVFLCELAANGAACFPEGTKNDSHQSGRVSVGWLAYPSSFELSAAISQPNHTGP